MRYLFVLLLALLISCEEQSAENNQILIGPQGEAGLDGVDGMECSLIEPESLTLLACIQDTLELYMITQDGLIGVDGINGQFLIDQQFVDGITGLIDSSLSDGVDGENGTVESNILVDGNGENGANGVDGTNGTNGINGNDGQDGIFCSGTQIVGGLIIICDGTPIDTLYDGVNGANGSNGTNGADGTNGTMEGTVVDGVNGANGDNCESIVIAEGYEVSCGGTLVDTIFTGNKGETGDLTVHKDYINGDSTNFANVLTNVEENASYTIDKAGKLTFSGHLIWRGPNVGFGINALRLHSGLVIPGTFFTTVSGISKSGVTKMMYLSISNDVEPTVTIFPLEGQVIPTDQVINLDGISVILGES